MEATNIENDSYKAEIEEYWVAPDKWRRTVRTEGFSSDLVVNGDKQSDSVSGDYYPNWLRTLATAIFDPGARLRAMDLTAPSDNPMPGSTLLCRRYSSLVGVSPVENRVFSTVCFSGDRLESVQVPGYSAEYKNYQDFDGKRIPRNVREYIEPGTELEARITELTEISTLDESLFAATQLASPPLQTVTVSEDRLRKLAKNPLELQWPSVRGGKTEGTLSIYVCLDRAGKVRETYALNSDHPGMSDAARQQLGNIQFVPVVFKNQPVQAEGILTFAYKTVIQDPYPELTDEQARERAITLIEPQFPLSVPRGTVVTVSVLVGEDGKVWQSGPFMGLPARLGSLAPDVAGWTFRPLLKDGKPTAFKAVLKFVVQ
ncbi:MAG: hypothetical protein ACLPVW_02995 [Terriglobales bacterium]